jgi:hypothetical protein
MSRKTMEDRMEKIEVIQPTAELLRKKSENNGNRGIKTGTVEIGSHT